MKGLIVLCALWLIVTLVFIYRWVAEDPDCA